MRITSYLFTAIILFSWQIVKAQQIAMYFTRFDCDSAEHHLFSELDEGEVIILDFVMLGCAPCIWATKNLDTIVQSFNSVYPGRVKIYSFSYESSHTCKQMIDWRDSGGFPGVSLFTDGADMVEYYGGMGMPTIIVTGGQDHKVFYNGFGYAPSHDSLIIAAIDSALNYSPSGSEEVQEFPEAFIFPTIFSDFLVINVSKDILGCLFTLRDASGMKIMESTLDEEGTINLQVGYLPGGMYFASFQDYNSILKAVKLIKY